MRLRLRRPNSSDQAYYHLGIFLVLGRKLRDEPLFADLRCVGGKRMSARK